MEKIDILIDNLGNSTSSEIKQYAQDVFGVVPQDFGEDADEIFSHVVDEILPMADDEEIDEYFEQYFGAYADEVYKSSQDLDEKLNSFINEELCKKGKAYTIFKEDDEKNILLIEKLIKKKIKKLSMTDINLRKQKRNIDYLKLETDTDKKISKQNFKKTFLPVENFLNFKESGQIPDFLNKKN